MHRPQSTAESIPTAQLWLRDHGRQALALAVLYFIFGHASFLVQVDDVLVTPVLFAPEGIALAMALRFGAAVWPGVFAGQLALALSLGLAPPLAASIAAVNSIEAVLAVFLFRASKLDASLSRARDLTGLLLLIFCVLQPFSATLGNATLWAGGIIERAELSASWFNWWIGNSFGQMLVAPLLLALFAGTRTRRQSIGDFVVPMLVIVPLFLVAEYLLGWAGISSLVAVFAPVLILLAIYRGLAAVCMAGLVIALGALYATGHALGPFVSEGRADIPSLNLFIIGLALSGQFLAVFLRQLREQQRLTDELRETREQLQRAAYDLTENIPIGTYTMVQPPDGGMAYFSFLSTRFLELTGLERDAARANPMNAFACVHPDDREEWVRKNAWVFEHKLPFKEECRVIVKGETRWITAESTPRDLPDGSVVWEGVLTDITDRKLAEQKVAASEARLRKILDNIPVPVAINDATKDGHITFLNEAFNRTFGYTPEDLPDVGAWARLAYPDEAYRAATFQTWDAAVAEAARTNGTVAPMEFRVRAKDGSLRDVLINAAALENMLLVGFVDITARKKAEDELRGATRRMTLAASAAGIGFWSRDLASHLEQWDDQMLAIYGVRREDFDGRWEPFVHPADLEQVQESTEQALRRGIPGRYEYRIIRPDGTVRHLRGMSVAMRDERGELSREIGVNFDITEEKAAAVREKQLEAQYRRDLETKLKTSLHAAAVAHEINQPLSAILLQSKMALQQESEAREALRVVAEEAQRVVITIDRMKTLMRNVQTVHEPVDLANVVRSSLLYNKGLFARQRISLREEGLDEERTIMGDDAQLQMAITNILRNCAEAIEESNPSKREISVALAARGDQVELTIGDSGPGWTGAESSETPLASTKKDGTGIGLYVVRTAVQNHGGKIEFGRSPLGGAEVKLAFPRAV